MRHAFLTANTLFSRVVAFALMSAVMPAATAQVETVSFTLNEVFLADGTQMTGEFDWTYTVGDFGDGSGVFTALSIPWRPGNSLPPLEDPGIRLTIEDKQIEISLDGNFHDYGLDIILKFAPPLSPTQPSILNLEQSFFECCGNGFKDQYFSSGSIVPISTTPVSNVAIDIYPNKINNVTHPHHDGGPAAIGGLNDIIPVVVFGSSTLVGDSFDFVATDIDPATVSFGPANGAIAPGTTPRMDKDFDNDGLTDAKFQFLTGDTGISCLDTEASISGETIGNQSFAGTAPLAPDCDAQCH